MTSYNTGLVFLKKLLALVEISTLKPSIKKVFQKAFACAEIQRYTSDALVRSICAKTVKNHIIPPYYLLL